MSDPAQPAPPIKPLGWTSDGLLQVCTATPDGCDIIHQLTQEQARAVFIKWERLLDERD